MAILIAGCAADSSVAPAQPDVALPAPPKNTIVTARLDEPITRGKNVLWCASFQLAWNELMDYADGPVTMTDAPPMVAYLNRRTFTKTDIDANSYVALAGRVADGTIAKARKQLAATFPGLATSLLPAGQSLPPDAIVMYAMLAKHLPFEHAFSRGGCNQV